MGFNRTAQSQFKIFPYNSVKHFAGSSHTSVFPNLSGFADQPGLGEEREEGMALREQRTRLLMHVAPFAQATSKHNCHSCKWSMHAHTCSLLAQVGMHALSPTTSEVQFKRAQGPVMATAQGLGDP